MRTKKKHYQVGTCYRVSSPVTDVSPHCDTLSNIALPPFHRVLQSCRTACSSPDSTDVDIGTRNLPTASHNHQISSHNHQISSSSINCHNVTTTIVIIITAARFTFITLNSKTIIATVISITSEITLYLHGHHCHHEHRREPVVFIQYHGIPLRCLL